MNRVNLFFLSIAVSICSANQIEAKTDNDLDKVKENYRSFYISSKESTDTLLADLIRIKPETEMSDQVVVELHQRYPFDLAKINSYLSKINPDGSWSDLNYADTKRSGWEPKQHADRILELAKLYYSDGTEYCGSPVIMEAIHKTLGYWFNAKPRCLNWWYNEIGVPKILGAAFILLENDLTPQEKESAVELMKASEFGRTGQNKVWLAGNVMTRALLQNDRQLVKAARDTIASEIFVGREEGIKSDWSFHQHGPQQQFGNYGMSFITGMSFFNRLFHGTAFQFDASQHDILASLVNEGYKWVIWNRHMDIGSLGRQFFHHSQLHKAYSLAFAAADLGISGFPKNGNPLIGHKHFHDSDYTVHRSKDWMGALKMCSTRVIGAELVNEDNLLGYYTGDGATFFYVRGDEYLDIFPLWDWRKIPGVTAFEDTAPIPSIRQNKKHNKSALVGGLSNGSYGMSAMQIDRDGLKANKAWLFTDRYAVCIGSEIKSDSALTVTTSIDQRLKCDNLEILNRDGWHLINSKQHFNSEELRFFHDNTGYIVFGKNDVIADASKRTGQWNTHMKMYKPADVSGDVISLHIDHGAHPSGGSYHYVVLPAATKESVEKFDLNAEIKVLRNDALAQAIQVPLVDNGCWITSYTDQPFEIDGKPFTPDAPGVYYAELSQGKWDKKQSAPFKID